MALYVFGSNIMGQCGLPEDHCNTEVPTPLGISGGEKVACGYLHALLLKDGELVTWGVNDEGALGRGGGELPAPVDLGERVAEISAGGSVSAAVTVSGGLYAWGTFRDTHGVFGLTPEGCEISAKPVRIVEGIAKVSCGKNFVAAVTRDGGLVTFGIGERGELGYKASSRLKRCLFPRQISNRYKKAEKFTEVFAGLKYGAAINWEGALFCWEGGGLRRHLEGTREAAVGSSHILALTQNGTVYARGENRDGQLGIGRAGKEPETEWKALEIGGVSKIRTKMDFSLAQVGNGIFSWGPSTFGETGFVSGCLFPRKIPFDFGEVVDFAAGSDFSVVLTR